MVSTNFFFKSNTGLRMWVINDDSYDKMSPKEVEKVLKNIVQNEAKQMRKVHVSAYKTTVC